jgi:L-threonylcarbamoyladenylate synthase
VPTTRIIHVDDVHPDPAAIARAAGVIRAGGLVAFATETVYGLGADATNPEAVARIFEAKGRPSTNPLIVHVEDKQAARACVSDWPRRADLLADRFWPGPLTLVLPRSPIIPDMVTAGGETVGVRVPDFGVARALILEAGRPIAAPSANRSNRISPTEAQHVLDELDGRVDLILDSGPTSVGIESTVLDLSNELAQVLRLGWITPEQIVLTIGERVATPERWRAQEALRSPGQLAVHYAPQTPTFRLDRDRLPTSSIEGNFRTLIVGGLPEVMPRLRSAWGEQTIEVLAEPAPAMRRLYAALHQLDALGLDFLLIVPPPDEPRWHALRDRIWRATQPWPEG